MEWSDETAVARARTGDADAFRVLVERHSRPLFRLAYRMTGNEQDAEDAVQETFLNAFRHIQRFDGRSGFSTWLTRIGINSALMMLRKKRNSREVAPAKDSESESPWEATDSAPNPEQQYAKQERLKLVRDAIAGLRPSIRRALEIHTLQGRSVEELASEIGISVCAAKARLFHARAALRRSRAVRSIRKRHEPATNRLRPIK